MEGAERVREAMERNVKAVTLRPAVGRGTAVTKVRLGRRALDAHHVADFAIARAHVGRDTQFAAGVVVRLDLDFKRVERYAEARGPERIPDRETGAERYSSYRDDFANAVPLRREVHITASIR
jgi:hypothetical protein